MFDDSSLSPLYFHPFLLNKTDYMKLNQEQNVHFEGKTVLGEGAESTVILSQVEHLGGEIAMKVFELSGVPSKRERTLAQTEFSLLNQLDGNEYIVKACAYIECGSISVPGTTLRNREMIALELCPHGDLFELVSEHHLWLQENQHATKNLIGQVFQAVNELHTKTKHAHLDLKLDNILIGSDFKIRLCDMGTATPLDEKFLCKYGTDDYMAPEVLKVSKAR